MSLLLENLAQAIPAMGPNPRVISDEIFSTAPISIGGVSVNMAAVVTIIIAAVVMAALQLFVQKTKLGRAMRAVSENKEASTLVGINVNRTIVTTFAIGSGLAAVAALMYCAQYHTVTTTMKVEFQIEALVNVKLAVVSEEKHVAYSPPARPAKNAEMTNVRIL